MSIGISGRRRRHSRSEAQLAGFRRSLFLDTRHNFIVHRKQLTRISGKDIPVRCQHNAASACVDQLETQQFFQPVNLQAYGRLGTAQNLTSLCEAREINDCEECPKHVCRQIDRSHPERPFRILIV